MQHPEHAAPRVLAVNVGSSSLRIERWTPPAPRADTAVTAQGIGGEGGMVVSRTANGERQDRVALPDHRGALEALLPRFGTPPGVDYVGHRVVHGGPAYRDPVWVDDHVLQALHALGTLIPLHMPPALQVIRSLRERWPGIPQAVVFDTAFHATLPPRAFEYAVPADWRARGIRRYGFHGLACADAVFQLGSALRERAVLLHLGAGCSATGLFHGKSIDTTMGLTPLEGLVMTTRCGDLDPGIPVYLQKAHGLSVHQIEHALNHDAGLLGLSGRSADMKTLLEDAATPPVALALEIFCYRAAKAVGAMAVALGGCDQIIFTGGIGEHAAPVRRRIMGHLEFLGVQIDEAANEKNQPVVSTGPSRIAVHVVRIDEGRQIAGEVARLIRVRPPTA
jgi:acetate kinase